MSIPHSREQHDKTTCRCAEPNLGSQFIATGFKFAAGRRGDSVNAMAGGGWEIWGIDRLQGPRLRREQGCGLNQMSEHSNGPEIR